MGLPPLETMSKTVFRGFLYWCCYQLNGHFWKLENLPNFWENVQKSFRSFSTDAVTNGFLTIFKPSQLQFQLFGEENWGNCHLPIRGFLLQNQHSKILSQKQLHRWKKYWKKVWCHFDGSRKTGLVRGEEERRIYRLLPPPPPPLGPPTHLSLPAKNLRRTEVTSWSPNIHLEKSYFYISENTQWRKDQPPTSYQLKISTAQLSHQSWHLHRETVNNILDPNDLGY